MKFKIHIVSSHVIGWLIFLCLPIMFMARGAGDVMPLLSSTTYLVFFSIFITVFYLFTYYLIPALYLKGKYFLFAISAVALLNVVYFAKPFDRLLRQNMPVSARYEPPRDGPKSKPSDKPLPRPPRGAERIDLMSIFLYVLALAMGLAINVTRQWRLTEKRALQAEAEKATAELSFLKAQINPHFLFNTLNNIYTLALTKNENTPDSILKLSHIMRYLTEDSSRHFVPLQDEISCISDYIDLQKLRLGTKSPVSFVTSGEARDKFVAPLIFMTFIENTFKYGVSKKDLSPITIEIKVDEGRIHFFCSNRLFLNPPISPGTGIGIENTRKRLEHLYPERFNLDISRANEHYTVNLYLHV